MPWVASTGTSETVFRTPRLQGLFLRGVDHDKGKDPNAGARTVLQEGGNAGDKVGSFQLYGTGKPANPFRATLRNYDMNKATDDAGCADPPGDWNNDTTPVDTYSGGDHESRPVNKYVFHIIKAYLLSPERTYIQPPVGTIIPFAGQKIVSSNWILCDGRSLSTRGDYKELYAAIGYAHGQAGTEEMVLPDYRGYFLRTVDQGKQGDPDAKSRTVPYPSGSSGQQGNAGDDVGSRQGSATGLPHKPFRTSLLHLPTSSGSKRVAGLLWQLAEVNGGSEDVTMTQSGGDAESRPANLAVDWLIRFK